VRAQGTENTKTSWLVLKAHWTIKGNEEGFWSYPPLSLSKTLVWAAFPGPIAGKSSCMLTGESLN